MRGMNQTHNQGCIDEALQTLYGLEQAKGYPHGFAVIDPADLTLVHLLKKAGGRQ